MPTALITGIGGFVGGHLADRARAAGFEVVGLDARSARSIDLLRYDELRAFVGEVRPGVVFHLAGALRAHDFRALYEVNVVGSANLFEALVEAKVSPRVVVASSSAVYGNPVSDDRLTESSELRPITHYGASKVSQEAVARRYFHGAGLDVVIARSFNIIGPGQPSSLAAGAFAEQVAKAERSAERTLRVGDLSGSRDFVDVRDVAQALVALARAGRGGETYNVSSGRATPLRRCVDELMRLSRVPLVLAYDESRARANDTRAQVGDSTRITQDTGWAPEVGFERSIEDLLDSWRHMVAQAAGEP